MTPDERQLITGLFDRMKNVGSQSRDREAEQLIGDQVRAQPYAPYLLTQTVLVQDHALKAANDRILELEEQVRKAQPAGQEQGGSFLGGLGRMFGGGTEPRGSVPATSGQGFSQQQGSPWGNQGAPPQQGGPWTAQPQQGGGLFGGGGGGGGSFMKGALGAAAGVAGGVLVADGIRNLFSGGHNDPFGMASGLGGGMGGVGGGETVINNNYYDTPQDQSFADQGGDAGNFGGDPGGYSNAGDYGNDGGGDPGSYT